MTVVADYKSGEAGLIRIWVRSWESNGWKARLRARKTEKIKGHQSPIRLVNFSFRRPRKSPTRLPYKKFGSAGWERSPLVLFPENFSEQDILNCGRPV